MKDYKEIFENLIQEIFDLTEKDLVEWTPTKSPTENVISVSLNGDNGVIYTVKYKWEFSSTGWTLSTPSLHIGPPLDMFFYNFNYKKVSDLGKLIFDKYIIDFHPNESEVHEKIKKVSMGISVSGNREIKISDIIK